MFENKYIKNAGWLMAEKAFRFIVLLFVAAAVTRYLGPERLGVLNFAQSFVALFIIFSTLGLDSIVVKDLLDKNDDNHILMGTTFGLKLGASCFTLLMIFVLGKVFGFDQMALKGMVILGVNYILQSFNVIDFYFQSIVKSKYIVFGQFISLVVVSALKLWGIYKNLELDFFFYLFVVEVAVYILVYIICYKRVGESMRSWKFSWTYAKNLLRQSFPLILSGLTVTIYMKIDQIMIKELLSYEEVGYYSAAIKLTEVWYVIPMVIVSSVFPSIVNTYESRDDGEFQERLKALYSALGLFALSLAIVTSFLAPYIINILYGQEYQASISVLSIHIWGTIFIFLGVANSKWFIVKGLQHLTFYFTLFSTFINVGLNYVLIPKIGINGAAIATIVSTMCASYIGMFFFYKQCKENIILSTQSLNPFFMIKNILKMKSRL